MRKRILMAAFALTFIAGASLIMYSCHKKKDRISVIGYVFDPNSGIYVEGVTVVLSSSSVQSGVYSTGYHEIARATTDVSGSFSFDIEEERVAGYRIYIDKNGYFSYTADITTDEMPAGETYEPVYQIYPIGYIKLKVVNMSPYDADDKITYSFTSGYMECSDCCDHNMHTGTGEQVNDSLKCRTRGNQDVSVTWNVTKHNQTILHSGNIYCKAFDTVSFQINY